MGLTNSWYNGSPVKSSESFLFVEERRIRLAVCLLESIMTTTMAMKITRMSKKRPPTTPIMMRVEVDRVAEEGGAMVSLLSVVVATAGEILGVCEWEEIINRYFNCKSGHG